MSKGYKPWWKMIFPLICFAFAGYIFYSLGTLLFTIEKESVVGVIVGWIMMAGFFIILGVYFGQVRDYHFDFFLRKYKIVTRVGPIGFGQWKNFRNLKYVSVFQNLDAKYQLNLWYDNNRHFQMDTFYNKDKALEIGETIAQSLKLRFHNAVDAYEAHFETEPEIEISKEDRNVDAYITEGQRPWWQTTIAAVLMTTALLAVYFFFDFMNPNTDSYYTGMYPGLIEIAVILFVIAIGFATVSDYQFDFTNKQLKHIYRVGPFKYGKWKRYKELEYISIFQKRTGRFDLLIWYDRNQKIPLGRTKDLKTAEQIAKALAKQLKIRIWDATDPHNARWAQFDE